MLLRSTFLRFINDVLGQDLSVSTERHEIEKKLRSSIFSAFMFKKEKNFNFLVVSYSIPLTYTSHAQGERNAKKSHKSAQYKKRLEMISW